MLSICRRSRQVFLSPNGLAPFALPSLRSLSLSSPALARNKKKNNAPPVISKKKLQAKERRRELKRIQKVEGAYAAEQMSLIDAIRTLRVTSFHLFYESNLTIFNRLSKFHVQTLRTNSSSKQCSEEAQFPLEDG